MTERRRKILFAILGFISISIIGFDFTPKILEEIVPCKLPPQIIDQLGDYAFKLKMQTCTLSNNKEHRELIGKVKDRLLAAAKRSKYGEAAKDFSPEITLIEDNEVANAFAVPSGKIAVYSGVFSIVDTDEAQLAVILGHELTHALARHAKDRIDKQLCGQIATASAGLNLKEGGLSTEATLGIMAAMGIAYEGAVMKPYIREQEVEADHMGLLLTADAGYNPETALTFWNEMKRVKKVGVIAVPNFLANHPDTDERIRLLKKWMPEALEMYANSQVSEGS